MVTISQIKTGFTKVYTEGEIEKIEEPRIVKLKKGGEAKVADAVLKDASGTITLSLWDEMIQMVKPGTKVKVENAFVNTYKGINKLSLGKYGKLLIV